MRVLVTGGAGFIGSNLIRQLLAGAGADLGVVNLDKLTYAGSLENLRDVRADTRHTFIQADIADADRVDEVFTAHHPEAVVHLAAESHVDRSIEDAAPFVRTNIVGTQILLEAAVRHGVDRFLQVSTDEVYGTLSDEAQAFSEGHPLCPTSPYAASKAAADHLALACHRTHGLGVVVARCSNNYGPYQFPEKLIPLMILRALHDEPLPVYGEGANVRDWIHVEDHVRALTDLLGAGRPGEVYNIGGRAERRNLDVVRTLLRLLAKPASLIRFVADRPGHDHRYAMDIQKIEAELGWTPERTFEQGLEETVAWYRGHRDWVEHVTGGEFRDYIRRLYAERLAGAKRGDDD